MKDRVKVVIDTNVLIDGWFFEKPAANRILDLIDERKLYLLFAQDTIGELLYVAKNFARHHIDEKAEQLNFLHEVTTLFYYSKSVNTMDTKIESSNDPYDDMFLKCAIEGEAEYLITDDFEHGLHSRQFDRLKVVSSDEFVRIFDEKHSVKTVT